MSVARHTYDRSATPPFDAVLGAAVVQHLRRLACVTIAAAGAELAIAGATLLWGPAEVRWVVYGGGPRFAGSFWDVTLPALAVLVGIVASVAVGGALMAASGVPLVRRIAAAQPHTGVPRRLVVGSLLLHIPSLSLALAALAALLESGGTGTLVAGLVPQFGSIALVGYLVHRRSRLDPWICAEKHRSTSAAVL